MSLFQRAGRAAVTSLMAASRRLCRPTSDSVCFCSWRSGSESPIKVYMQSTTNSSRAQYLTRAISTQITRDKQGHLQVEVSRLEQLLVVCAFLLYSPQRGPSQMNSPSMSHQSQLLGTWATGLLRLMAVCRDREDGGLATYESEPPHLGLQIQVYRELSAASAILTELFQPPESSPVAHPEALRKPQPTPPPRAVCAPLKPVVSCVPLAATASRINHPLSGGAHPEHLISSKQGFVKTCITSTFVRLVTRVGFSMT